MFLYAIDAPLSATFACNLKKLLPNALTSATFQNVSFPLLGTPPLPYPQRLELFPYPPALLPVSGSRFLHCCRPSSSVLKKMNIVNMSYNLLKWYTIYRQKVHYLLTFSIIYRHGTLFAAERFIIY
jgi:hypothetical protein